MTTPVEQVIEHLGLMDYHRTMLEAAPRYAEMVENGIIDHLAQLGFDAGTDQAVPPAILSAIERSTAAGVAEMRERPRVIVDIVSELQRRERNGGAAA